MKLYLLLFLILSISSCRQQHKTNLSKSEENKIIKSEFQTIIDSANVNGAILIYDLHRNNFYSNDFNWTKQGKLPASTFKIANTIIGLETGVIKNDSTIFKWDGQERWLDLWEQDLILRDAFHYSCVPCYQQVATKIGPQRMNEHVKKIEYGDLKIDSNNISNFWLEGESRINQMQQIDFLKRFYSGQLPISVKTQKIVKQIMVIDTENYTLSGKTGLSISNEQYNGWFVGYIEVRDNVYFFATNLEPTNNNIDLSDFIQTRKEVTLAALKALQVIK
ncbi:class D beta-lactamase [Maribacter litoralis]|uniref:Beta-lactamase n=1 Tax=Maribacter litoralis TaxID=2059726 RepID=A0A653XR73_9FLAO|nr:class D beta-lactamase [Maribacter litoralis]VXC32612.1 Beta-lactamase class D [Maribacter litoralis]